VLNEAATLVEQASRDIPRVIETELLGSPIHEEIDLLLREQDDRVRALSEVHLPVRIQASKFKEFVSNIAIQAEKYLRPIPTEPYRATKTGTAFHSRVEDFLISEVDNHTDQIADLSEIFKKSRFRNLSPVEVEIEINLTRGLNTFVCKLDAVFKVGERLEIVDWKTGSAPKEKTEQEFMAFQLALYRFAYSELRSIPIESIDISFYFVADNLELTPEFVPNPAELITMWEDLFS